MSIDKAPPAETNRHLCNPVGGGRVKYITRLGWISETTSYTPS